MEERTLDKCYQKVLNELLSAKAKDDLKSDEVQQKIMGAGVYKIGGVKDLSDYSATVMSVTKEKLLRSISEDISKHLSVRLDTKGDLDKLVSQLKQLVPDPRKDKGNGKQYGKGKTTHSKCKKMAEIINKHYSSKVVDPKASEGEICESVAEVMNTLITGLTGEFISIRDDVKQSIQNLAVLKKFLADGVTRLIAAMEEECEGDITQYTASARAIVDAYLQEIAHQLAVLQNMLDVVKPADKSLADLLRDSGEFKLLVKKVKAIPGEGAFGEKMSYAVSSMSTAAIAAKMVDDALKNVGLSVKEYTEVKGMADLKEKLAKLMSSKIGKAKTTAELKKLFAAGDLIMRNEYRHEDIVKQLKGKKGAGEKTKKTEGGAKLEKRIENRRQVRKKILKIFNQRLGAIFSRILSTLESFVKKIGGEIPFDNDALRKFVTTFDSLDDIGKQNIYYSLVGYTTDITSQKNRERFLGQVDLVIDALKELKHPKIASHAKDLQMYFRQIVDLIKDMEGTFDKLPAVSGKKKRVEGGSDLPEITKLAYTINKAKSQLKYYYHTAKVFGSFKIAANEIEEVKPEYVKVLGDSIAKKRGEIKKEFKDFKEQIEDKNSNLGKELNEEASVTTPNTLTGKDAIADYKKETIMERKQIKKYALLYKEEMCKAKEGLYKVAEAVDRYLLEMNDAVLRNPKDIEEMLVMLDGTEIIAEWFNEKTGNLICEMFDSCPSSVTKSDVYTGSSAKTETYHKSIKAKDLDGTHYYQYIYDKDRYIDVGNPRNPVQPNLAKNTIEVSEKVLNNLSVLKNIVSIFINIGNKVGGEELYKKTNMTPYQIYKLLINYIRWSAFKMGTNKKLPKDPEKVMEDEKYDKLFKKIFTDLINENYFALDASLDFLSKKLENFRDSFDTKNKVYLNQFNNFAKQIDTLYDKIRSIQKSIVKDVKDVKNFRTDLNSVRVGIIDLQKKFAANLNPDIVLGTTPTGTTPTGTTPTGITPTGTTPTGITPTGITPTGITPTGTPTTTTTTTTTTTDLTKTKKIFEDLFFAANNYNDKIKSVESFLLLNKGDFTKLIPNPDKKVTELAKIFAFYLFDKDLIENFRNNFSKIDQGAVSSIIAAKGWVKFSMLYSYVIESNKNALKWDSNNNNAKNSTYGKKEQGIGGSAEKSDTAVNYYVQAQTYISMADISDSDFEESDKLFHMILKAMAAKVFTIIGVFNIFNRPIEDQKKIDQYRNVRLVLGGDETYPEILQPALELYMRLPQLAEFYREVFKFGELNKADDNKVTILPDSLGIFGRFIDLIFNETAYVEQGSYSATDSIEIIKEINKIYIKFRGENAVSKVINAFVKEINSRIGILDKDNRVKYLKDKYFNREKPVSTDDILDMEILPGGEDDDDFVRPSYSNQYLEPEDVDYSRKHKFEIKVRKHKDLIDNIRKRMNDALKINTDYDMNQINNLIVSKKEELKLAKTKKARFDVAFSVINGFGSISVSAIMHSLLILHETVSMSLTTMYHVYKVLENINAQFANEAMTPNTINISQTLEFLYYLSGDLIDLRLDKCAVVIDLSKLKSKVSDQISMMKDIINKMRGVIPNDTLKIFEDENEKGSIYWMEKHFLKDLIKGEITFENDEIKTKESLLKFNKNIKTIMEHFGKNFAVAQFYPLVFWGTFNKTKVDRMDKIDPHEILMNNTGKKIKDVASSAPLNNLFSRLNPESSKGYYESKGIMSYFNKTILELINEFYDPALHKIYNPLINEFATGTFSGQVMLKELHADLEDKFNPGEYGIPKTTLLSTVGMMLHYIVTIPGEKGTKYHLENDLAEMPIYMKEKMKAGLPLFKKKFMNIIKKSQIVKHFLEQFNFTESGTWNTFNVKTISDKYKDVVTENFADKTNTPVDAKKAFLKAMDQMISGAQSLINGIDNVLDELDDEPIYGELYESFIKDFKDRNGQTPLALLSNLNTIYDKQSKALESSEGLKLLYSSRGVLYCDTKYQQLEGFSKLVERHNETVSERHKLLRDFMVKFSLDLISNVKYMASLTLKEELSLIPATGPKLVNSKDKEKVAVCQEFDGDFNKAVNYIASPYVKNSIQDVISCITKVDPCVQDRKEIRALNIYDLNIVPINVNMLMREIPLTYLYNYSYTFDELVKGMFPNPNGEIFKNLLGSPFTPLDGQNEFLFNKSIRGTLGLDMGRPKFLGKEVFNKALFEELYINYDFDKYENPEATRIRIDAYTRGYGVGNDYAMGVGIKTVDPSDSTDTDSIFGLRYPVKGKVETVKMNDKRKESLKNIGKKRRDTKFIRNIIFLTTLQRVMRLKMRRELMWYGNDKTVKDHKVLASSITELFGH